MQTKLREILIDMISPILQLALVLFVLWHFKT